MKRQLNNDGFSLIELLITLVVSAIVMSVILALMTYSSNQMASTQQKVSVQDEAKDIMNHITNYAQEGSTAEWKTTGSQRYLLIKNDSENVATSKRREVVYWQIGKEMYFASTDDVPVTSLTADKRHLLGENVKDFECSIEDNVQSKTKLLKIDLSMKTAKASMDCTNNIYLRNQ